MSFLCRGYGNVFINLGENLSKALPAALTLTRHSIKGYIMFTRRFSLILSGTIERGSIECIFVDLSA